MYNNKEIQKYAGCFFTVPPYYKVSDYTINSIKKVSEFPRRVWHSKKTPCSYTKISNY